MNCTNEFLVEKENTLFNYLLENIKNKSKNNIKSLLINKCVSVNNIIITNHNFKLRKNDKIVIYNKQIRNKFYNINIIYEDKNIIVIDKPSGLLPIATEKEKNITAYKLVMDYLKQKSKNNKIFVVHRLDKDTSGVLMFAKNENVKNLYQDNWNELVKKREYLGIIEGSIKNKSGTIKNYLKEDNFNKMYISDSKNGKLAITHYKILKTNKKFSLLEINIDTGRKNQIRIHMSEFLKPIVGDKKYGAKTNPLKRLGLHAYMLKIIDPLDNKEKEFVSPIPIEFINLFK
ncbi:MAG: RluA family pseudouridine synthase [Bacilli bacterium]|nr:RluA family pseudouridine synthase [Bacilli bacterium]